MTTKYQRLQSEDESSVDKDQIELLESGHAATSTKSPNFNVNLVAGEVGEGGQNQFSIKIIYREEHHEILGLTESSTIAALKLLVSDKVGVPATRQRLIFKGRPLKPDEGTLHYNKISSESVIHLFPLPEAVAVLPASSATSSQSSSVSNTLGEPQIISMMRSRNSQYNDDPMDRSIEISRREVRMWTMLLTFMSISTLFNNVNYLLVKGEFGAGIFDSIVNFVESVLAVCGLKVAQLGLRSCETLDINIIKQYVYYLFLLAIASVTERIAWVFDVVFQVQALYDEQVNEGTSGDHDNRDVPSDPNTLNDDIQLTEEVVHAFAVQASMVAMIGIMCWMSCVQRAVRLRIEIESIGANTANRGSSGDAQI